MVAKLGVATRPDGTVCTPVTSAMIVVIRMLMISAARIFMT